MTDKQIIIDGVDVSKCKYFDCDSKECKAEYYVRHGYEIVEYDSCRKNKNCDFKQLKRKEQEYDKLKAENEELRNFHINLVGVKECDIRELLKLKQTLTEIKEIAEKSCCLQPTSDCEEYENCKECSRTNDDETVKQLLQKISEVEK